MLRQNEEDNSVKGVQTELQSLKKRVFAEYQESID